NKQETIKYVLQLKGLLEEEEKFTLPNSFLMEMMDLNESIMDAKMDGDEDALNNLKDQIHHFETEIYEPVKKIIEHTEGHFPS
ncbi:iron-sulfur cluster co-chaperone HscB C-terminal domain-containing protein, partial [Escherichia coli]